MFKMTPEINNGRKYPHRNIKSKTEYSYHLFALFTPVYCNLFHVTYLGKNTQHSTFEFSVLFSATVQFVSGC
jgi:hypothetical protein